LRQQLKLESKVIDVRESRYEAEHVEAGRPLAYEWVKDINPEEHFFIHCAGGYRSMMAASIYKLVGETSLKLKVV
jgi:rhodanese-related sulfurtransferase